MHTSHITIPNGDLQIDAYLAQPTDEGAFPAVIVIQEIFGVNAHIREVTERVASMGYVAIAPAIYQRQAPGFEIGYSPEDVVLGRKYKEQTHVDQLLSDLTAAIAYLQHMPNVRSEAIGCIGFCFGGHVAYLAATLPQIKATASFYGAGIPTWCPGNGAPTITYTPRIAGTLYAFFGTDDPSIPPEHIAEIELALQQNQVSHRIFQYPGAQHGFCCDRRASYDAASAEDAWQRVETLFHDVLGQSPPKL
ncbi:dienelactone hydrolase family protein [Leptolyngbya sp. AN02str]|uniref:dienelactone hydrolase family protein n=1 Tax=Leptolyngbya sp. AN02str TaxID=3423363 RepID=UPI003D31E9B4